MANHPVIVELAERSIDLARRVIRGGDKDVSLTQQDVDLLQVLMAGQGSTVTNETLYREVWGYHTPPRGRALTFAIRRLREKIELDFTSPVYILTVRGVGYRWENSSGASASAFEAVRDPVENVDNEFVGREVELELLKGRMKGKGGLTTLVGWGGVGKTRLARELALSCQNQEDVWPGGVVFCELSDARTTSGLLHQVYGMLGLKNSPDLSEKEAIFRLGHALEARSPMVLVLDNLEQMIEIAALFVAEISSLARSLDLLVTAREPLRVTGETVLRLEPLTEADGVQLFLQRLSEQGDTTEQSVEQQESVQAIVHRLEGLPLALELAAARARMLPLAVLASRLDRQLNILRQRGPGIHERQSTLRATIDWSWNLLAEEERRALIQLAVFRGAAHLEAIERCVEVTHSDDPEHILELIQSLIEKSLLRRISDGGSCKYGMLVGIREYLEDQIGVDETNGAIWRRACSRHAEYFFGLPGVQRSQGRVHLLEESDRRLLVSELDNLLVALDRSIDAAETAIAVGICLAIMDVMRIDGGGRFFLGEIARVLALSTLSDEQRWDLEFGRVRLQVAMGELKSVRAEMSELIARAEAAGDKRRLAHALLVDSKHLAVEGGVGETSDSVRTSLAIYRELNDSIGVIQAQGVLGWKLMCSGDLDDAERVLCQSFEGYLSRGHRLEACAVLGNLATLCWWMGRRLESHERAKQALDLAREVGHRSTEAVLLGNLGLMAAADGRLDEAMAFYEEGLAIQRARGFVGGQAIIVGNVANLVRLEGRTDEAIRWYAEAERLALACGNRHYVIGARGNSADHLLEIGRTADAKELVDDVIEEARELEYWLAVAVFLSVSGTASFRLGDGDAGRLAFAEGVQRLKDLDKQSELLKVMCRWGTAEAEFGCLERAQELRTEAQANLSVIPGGPDYEINRYWNELNEALGLSGGEDLP